MKKNKVAVICFLVVCISLLFAAFQIIQQPRSEEGIVKATESTEPPTFSYPCFEFIIEAGVKGKDLDVTRMQWCPDNYLHSDDYFYLSDEYASLKGGQKELFRTKFTEYVEHVSRIAEFRADKSMKSHVEDVFKVYEEAVYARTGYEN